MAFTRYNYDSLRTQKKLQQSTGTCRYMLNVPGPFSEHCYMQDPQIRIQKFGANLMNVKDGHPIDIDSDLKGVGRKLKAGGMLNTECSYKHNELQVRPMHFETCTAPVTDQSRVTHPARNYKSLEQNRRDYPLFDPQENTCLHFQNNLSTRLLERDNYVPKLPCL